jgi:hypothetical protein
MTRDDIIRLARQASEVGSMWWRARDTLERFAALVESEAAARETKRVPKSLTRSRSGTRNNRTPRTGRCAMQRS